jgi:hypothetical protein
MSVFLPSSLADGSETPAATKNMNCPWGCQLALQLRKDYPEKLDEDDISDAIGNSLDGDDSPHVVDGSTD